MNTIFDNFAGAMKSMKKYLTRTLILIFIAGAVTPFVSAQSARVKWYTIQEAEKLVKANPRPIVIDTYTDWCGWCKKLDQETFSNPVIAEILNTVEVP